MNNLLLCHRKIACKTNYHISFRFTARLYVYLSTNEILSIWRITPKNQLIKVHFSMNIPFNLKTINLAIMNVILQENRLTPKNLTYTCRFKLNAKKI